MKLIDLLRLSFTNLKGNRLRTILTILGVGIGIGAILFLVTLGFGLQRLTIQRIVQSAALNTLDVSAGQSSILKLDDSQIEKIKKIPHVNLVSPSISLPGQIIFRSTTTDCVINGVDENYFELEGIKVSPEKILFRLAGAEEEIPEMIVSTGTLKLFGVEDPQSAIKEKVDFNIFITEESGATGEMKKVTKAFKISGIVDDTSSLAYVSVGELRQAGVKNYTSVKVRVDEVANINEVKSSIGELGFSSSSVADMIEQIQKIFQIIQGVLAGFGIIALLVASIGMFNTMTIALLERTRDIGIMKAIGARRKDIRRMFITEAALMGLAGGLVGVIGGYLLGTIINLGVNTLAQKAGGEAVSLFYTPWQFVAGIMLFAFIVGIITGIYPARRAARINPLEALRYE